MTFDEITNERKAIYSRGNIVLHPGKMIAKSPEFQDEADRYNDLADQRKKAIRS